MPAKRYLMEDDGLPLMVKVTEAANDKLVTALLASVVASLSTLNFGYALGFTSPTEVEMTSDGTLDADQFSWFSVSHIFCLFCLLIYPSIFHS